MLTTLGLQIDKMTFDLTFVKSQYPGGEQECIMELERDVYPLLRSFVAYRHKPEMPWGSRFRAGSKEARAWLLHNSQLSQLSQPPDV